MRILITCTQYPYHGGAATNSYAMIKALRDRGHKVCGIFFEDSNVNCDPDQIRGILKAKGGKFSASALRTATRKILGGDPHIILAKNYVAPILSKKIFPNVNIIYLVSGSPLMRPLSAMNISAVKFLSGKTTANINILDKNTRRSEERAIRVSSGLLVNSVVSKAVLKKTYSAALLRSAKISDPINTSIIINKNCSKTKVDFNKRDIDIGFVSSSFSRTVKNADFAKKIFSHNLMSSKKKLAIGSGSSKFKGIKNIITKGKTSNGEVVRLMGRTKLVICPSYFDASPNIINEALQSGCNVLLSPNCGWSENFGNRNLCRDVYSVTEWVKKASYLCNNKVFYNDISKKDHVLSSLEKFINKVRRS